MTAHEHDNQRETGRDSGSRLHDPVVVACPFCHSTDTERFALFGSRLSTDHYTCNTCHTAFERIRHTAR